MSTQFSNSAVLSAETHLTALVPVWDAGEETRVLPSAGSFVLGSAADCDIRVVLQGIAPQHCRIECHNGVTIVTPVDGRCVWVNHARINNSQRIITGDVLAVGSATYRIESRHRTSVRQPVAGHTSARTQRFFNSHVADSHQQNSPGLAHATGQMRRKSDISRSPACAAESVDEDQRRRALDNREAQLTDLQIRLQQRSMELDVRAERLTQQQAQLLTRQTQLDQRKAEIEAQYEDMFDQINLRQTELLDGSAKQIAAQKTELDELSVRLDQRQHALRDRELRLQMSSDKLADKEQKLNEVRDELDAARERHSVQLAEVQKELDKAAVSKEEQETLRREHEQEVQLLRGELAELTAQHAHERQEWQQQSASLSASADSVAMQKAELETAQEEFEQARQDHLERITAAREELESREAELQQQLQTVEQQSRSIADSVSDIERQSQELEAAREQLQLERDQQLADLQSVRAQMQELEADLIRRESELARQETEQQQRSNLLDSRETDTAAQRQRIEQQVEELRLREAEVAQTAADCDQRTADLNCLEAETQERLQQIEKLQAEFDQQAADAVDRVAGETDRVAELDARESEIEQLFQQLESQSVAVQQNAEQLQSELEQSRDDHEQAVADWQQQQLDAEQRLNQKQATLDTVEQQLRDESEQLKSQHQLLAEQTHAAEERERQLQVEMEQRSAELTSWETELQQRYDETAERVQLIKQLSAEARVVSVDADPKEFTDEQKDELSEKLENARQQVADLEAERSELTTALTELRSAFDSVREELVERNEQDSSESAALEELRQKMDLCDDELNQLRDELAQKQDDNIRLQQQLQDVAHDFEQEREALDRQLQEFRSQSGSESDDPLAESLLEQVEELRAQLSAARDGSSGSATEFAQQVQAYERQIEDLSSQLAAEREGLSAAPGGNDDQFLEVIAELKQTVEDQQVEIQELQSTNADADLQGMEEVQLRHRELDDRTHVLDQREEEIRERQRMLDLSEGELEDQRRDLLESRQQLEMARAEIHVAMDVGSEPEFPAVDDHAEPAEDDEEPIETPTEDQPHVRSEFAELFGMTGAAAEPSPEADEIDPDLPAVDHYSQESAAAVSMSFSESQSMLLEAEASQETSDSEEDDNDDYVASYMEQLLARNRETAGGALPQELTKKSQAVTAVETKAPEPAKPTGQTSFIEAYMSGDYGSPDVAADDSHTPAASQQATSEPKAPRQKIDLDALRNNMDSFRQLSTKSVENALATHAKQQERGGLAARMMICSVLALVCIFVVGAALMEVIPFGPIVWVSLLAGVVSCVDLGLKSWSVRRKVNNAADNLSHDTTTDQPVEVPSVHDVHKVDAEPAVESDLTEEHLELDESDLLADVSTDIADRSDAVSADTDQAATDVIPQEIVDHVVAEEPDTSEVELPELPAAVASLLEPEAQPEPELIAEATSNPPSTGGDATMERTQIEKLLAEITGAGATDDGTDTDEHSNV